MSTISTYRAAVLSIVKTQLDDAARQIDTTPGGDIDLAVQDAVTHHSKLKPRTVVVALAGNGTARYALTGTGAVVSDWQDGLSDIALIAYPYDETSDDVVDPLDNSAYYVGHMPGGVILQFTTGIRPLASEKMLVQYKTLHVVDGSGSTIPPVEETAVHQLAASYVFLKLAAYAANTVEGSIAADSTTRTTSDVYMSLSKRAREAWAGMTSPRTDDVPQFPSFAFRIESTLSDAGRTPHLFRGR